MASIDILTHIPNTLVDKAWARFPQAFDEGKVGGYAIVGRMIPLTRDVDGNGEAILKIKHFAPWVYVGFSLNTGQKYGFLFVARKNGSFTTVPLGVAGNRIECNAAEYNFALAMVETQTYHMGIVYNDPLAWAAGEGVSAQHIFGCRNPHYRMAAWMLAKGFVSASGTTGSPPPPPPVQSPNPSSYASLPVTKQDERPAPKPAQPEMIVRSEDKFDKGSKKKAETMNELFPLPGKIKWAGQLSGIWMVMRPDGKYDIAAVAFTKHMAEVLASPIYKDKNFFLILQEQHALILGAAAVLESIKTLLESE